mmetsp:Transcript_26827/g.53684  ORF Transcript_26827/g.53684 Transcript_26827/m.53684 type:complete len:544 (-) Transcript_26827:82-1713(-)
MVGRLIQKKHIRVQKHGSGKSELHAPASGKSADTSIKSCGGTRHTETHISEHSTHLILSHTAGDDLGIGHDVVKHSHVSLLTNDLALHVHSNKVSREALQVAASNGLHQSTLSGTVGTHKTVSAANLDLERGLVQQHAGTVGEGEGGVTEILLLVFRVNLLSGQVGSSNNNHLFSDGGGLLLRADDGNKVRHEALHPLLLVAVVTEDQEVSVLGHELNKQVELGGINGSLGERSIDRTSELLLGGDLVGKDGSLSRHAQQSLKRRLAHLTHFLHSDLLNSTLQNGLQNGVELCGGTRVVHELTHVTNNQRRATLDGHLALAHALSEDRNKQTKGGKINIVNEGGANKGIKSTLSELDGVHVGSSHSVNDRSDINVGDCGSDLSESNAGLILDLLLHIGSHLDELVDHLRQVALHNNRVVVGKVSEENQSSLLGLPLHGSEGLVKNRGNDAHRVSVRLMQNSISSSLSSHGSLGGSQVVKNEWKDVHHVRLNPLIATLAQSLHGLKSIVGNISRSRCHVCLKGIDKARSLEGDNSRRVHNLNVS